MTKVWCAETECEHYSEDGCTAKEINISAGHLHTKHQGYIHHWECRTFKMSEEAEKLFGMLKAYFDNMEKEKGADNGVVALEDVVDLDKQTKDNNAAMRKVIDFIIGGADNAVD